VDSDYVALHLSPEVHGATVRQLNVSAFPTTIVLDQNLKFHNGAAGFLDAKHLLALLKHRPARVAANAEAAAQ
ncbi:MAG: hypothetical protein KDA41_22285, partial [Planctomycetales bacterium]|nr:hypothetical protein [Planctomycetales bacterium]